MLLNDISRRIGDWYRAHHAIARLSRIDDRLLADMGVARDAIVERVKGRRQA